ncbi:MAG: gfo/Idh/MocA family oxidoreductase, partial [Phycisphaerales bacterium]
MDKPTGVSRRDFVRNTVGVTMTAPAILGTAARAQGRIFKVGLIGCGGRGRGAAAGALDAAK